MSVAQPAKGPCVVWGGYGYGNTGDDLVLAVALHDLRPATGQSLRVLSPTPAQTRLAAGECQIVLHPSRPTHAFEKWFWRWTDYAEAAGLSAAAAALYRLALKHPRRITREPAWLQALTTASRLHLAGGGYLADRFDLRQFLRPLRVARSRGLPITTSPLGLGPFQSSKKAKAVAAALRGARVLVRDADSLRFCETRSVPAIEAPDDGFRWREVVKLPSIPTDELILGVCIFPQYSTRWSDAVEGWWVSCLQALHRTLPAYRLEGFCFHTGVEMDYETTRRLFARAGLNPDHVRHPDQDFRFAVQNLARYRAVVSTRFHAVVVAGMTIPCVAVVLDDYYESKMRGALKHAGSPALLAHPLSHLPAKPAEWLTPLLTSSSRPTAPG